MSQIIDEIDIDTITRLARYGIDLQYQPPVEDKVETPHNQNNTTPSELVTETTLLTTTNCWQSR